MPTMIDPPGGWRHGFPKKFNNPKNLSTADWLVENGYPKKELILDDNGEPKYVRFWGEDDPFEPLLPSKVSPFRVKDYLDSPAMKLAYYREVILDSVKLYFRPITWLWELVLRFTRRR